MKGLHVASTVLLIIGGLNWLLLVFGWELGDKLLGGMDSSLTQLVYVLIGFAAIYEIFTHRKNCAVCR